MTHHTLCDVIALVSSVGHCSAFPPNLHRSSTSTCNPQIHPQRVPTKGSLVHARCVIREEGALGGNMFNFVKV